MLKEKQAKIVLQMMAQKYFQNKQSGDSNSGLTYGARSQAQYRNGLKIAETSQLAIAVQNRTPR